MSDTPVKIPRPGLTQNIIPWLDPTWKYSLKVPRPRTSFGLVRSGPGNFNLGFRVAMQVFTCYIMASEVLMRPNLDKVSKSGFKSLLVSLFICLFVCLFFVCLFNRSLRADTSLGPDWDQTQIKYSSQVKKPRWKCIKREKQIWR